MKTAFNILKSYIFSFILLLSIILGGLVGCYFPTFARDLKPLGDIFINLILTAIIPLIFFSISSAIARSSSFSKLSKIILSMLLVFLFTGVITSLCAICLVSIFPPANGVVINLPHAQEVIAGANSFNFYNFFTVTDFSKLLSHENILPLIVFSILVGMATSKVKNRIVIAALNAGEKIFMKVFSYIMYYAPIGFFAYFAYLVTELGSQLMANYLRIFIMYYAFAIVYFVLAYTGFAYLAAKKQGVVLYWKNVFLPMITAIATCSSAASIPANLVACKEMRIAPEIYETVIPLGTMIHKNGSIVGGIVKIAFIFGLFHMSFSGIPVLFTAVIASLLVGTVMGAIPSGGMLGELLILNFYGFPSSYLIVIVAIGLLIDPIATMLNVTGNTVNTMLVARLIEGKKFAKSVD